MTVTTYGVDIATGGHRGDLTQVGPDGCIYATQGRFVLASLNGTRYDNGDETSDDSIVKICSAVPGDTFTPGTGVTDTIDSDGPALSLACVAAATGEVGVDYHSSLVVTGGTGPYTYTVSDSLPPGLTLDSATGAITGTPTTAGPSISRHR